ncbi:protein of unknown function [Streptomyces sp. KY70]|nr:protein of unknown function [Streptomyces sp. KY70]
MTSSTTVHSPLRLYGRSGELAILEGLLARLWQGDGGALVVTAPPGLGRSALLREAAAAHRPRGPVLYATASPDERGRHALPRTPEALLARLRERGAARPLLVCADDAHAWDPASRTALALAARRLGAGSRVAVLIAADDVPAFAGLPALRLGPLDGDAAAALLDRLAGGGEGCPVGRTAPAVARHGFPASRGTRPGRPRRAAPGGGREPAPPHRAHPPPHPGPAGRAHPAALSAARRRGVLAAHADRLDGLPGPTRALLLLAAAAQEHEPPRRRGRCPAPAALKHPDRAARDFLDGALFGSAATEGFLQRAGSRVHFSHPLFARAVLHDAPPARRRATHELLAALLAETGDRAAASAPARGHPASPGAPVRSGEGPVRPAHSGDRPALPGTPAEPSGDRDALPLAALVQLSCAAPGPDTVLAARLEAAATALYPHGERSSALCRAAALTTGPPLRSARFAAAAEQAALAGDPDRARALLARTGAAGSRAPRPVWPRTSTACSPCAPAPPPTPTRPSSPRPPCSARTTPGGDSTPSSARPRRPGWRGRARLPGGHGPHRPRPVRPCVRLLPGRDVCGARRTYGGGARAAPTVPRPCGCRRPRRPPPRRGRRPRPRGGRRRLPDRGPGARRRTDRGA